MKILKIYFDIVKAHSQLFYYLLAIFMLGTCLLDIINGLSNFPHSLLEINEKFIFSKFFFAVSLLCVGLCIQFSKKEKKNKPKL